MPNLYFGIPVTPEEGCRLLGIEYDSTLYTAEVASKVSKILKNERSSKLQLINTDNRQCVLGYIVHGVNYVCDCDKFCSADDLIMKLIELKRSFSVEIVKLGVDLSHVTLEPLEGYPKEVSYPEPFVLCHY